MLESLFAALGANMPKYIQALQHIDSFLTNVVGNLETETKNAAIDSVAYILQQNKAISEPVESVVTPVTPVTPPEQG